jgi:hypothetical protein
MKYRDVIGGHQIYISNEEEHLISKIENGGFSDKNTLSDREKEVARKLVSRGVINRHQNDNGIIYVVNSEQELIRD